MLSSLRRSVFQTRNFTNGGNSNSATLSLVRLRSSVFIHNIHSSSSSSFVVNYLINSCGLSEHQAAITSKQIDYINTEGASNDFKTSSRPDSVLNLLETYGFTKPHISKLIVKYPKILFFDHQKTLKPKLDFFNSKGFSGTDLASFLSSYPVIFRTSLHDKLVPCCDTLKNIVHFDKNVITIIKRHPWILTGSSYLKNLKVNIELLRDEGIPQYNVSEFLVDHPITLTANTSKFEEIVRQIKSMGFDPSKPAFLLGIQVLTTVSKSAWEAKVHAYRKWGWTEEEFQNAFKKYPQCMMQPEEKITSTMDFLVNQMGYNSRFIAKSPGIFTYGLEKRIIPRCAVIKLLVSKGHIKEQIPLSALIGMPDKYFLEKYVSKYEVEIPDILKVYRTSILSAS